MKLASKIFVGLVAVEHLYIMVLETLLWTTRGLEVFKMTAEYAEMTKTLAFNQGWYNGFLAAGLIWTFLIKNVEWSRNIALFFLGCVVVAGIVGGLSAKISILYIQAAPAAVALLVTWMAGRGQQA